MASIRKGLKCSRLVLFKPFHRKITCFNKSYPQFPEGWHGKMFNSNVICNLKVRVLWHRDSCLSWNQKFSKISHNLNGINFIEPLYGNEVKQ